MNKRIIALLLACIMIVGTSTVAFAETWVQDANGWKLNIGNDTFAINTWKWSDGDGDGKYECYYFNELGYLIMNALTPDGYTVDPNGAWIVDKVIQKKGDNGPGRADVALTRDSNIANTSMDEYAAGLTYTGVDGTETYTIRTDDMNIYFDVVSPKTSAELTPEKAKAMYYADAHYVPMQKIANAALNFYRTSKNVVETITTADRVEVYKCTYYGTP